ncbi:NADH dehydrogenase [ubiquinone] iron-sulfur protein 6, mitochondrial-like [Saccostrea echinata]|uniref:NADH dehydrogenase [ubiquinone] iron-sulfur protein 6, mitochondrial-like n=1 Tax=Saccostrea echinata TaxID=191078 RepID=UPI002A8078D3|nr:NADH dehydrogenase [ubiquinone] iron-sulfur protein 6, mitochondrial-like [Saccostrea echinata]
MALTRALARVRILHTSVRLLATKPEEGRFVDEVTHTGQVWDKDDYRRIRFIDKKKLVNKNFAINLIAEDPVVVCPEKTVWSNSGGALGHPKVYINLDKPQISTCGYSGRKFIYKGFYNEAEHGPSITYDQYLEEMKPKERD